MLAIRHCCWCPAAAAAAAPYAAASAAACPHAACAPLMSRMRSSLRRMFCSSRCMVCTTDSSRRSSVCKRVGRRTAVESGGAAGGRAGSSKDAPAQQRHLHRPGPPDSRPFIRSFTQPAAPATNARARLNDVQVFLFGHRLPVMRRRAGVPLHADARPLRRVVVCTRRLGHSRRRGGSV